MYVRMYICNEGSKTGGKVDEQDGREGEKRGKQAWRRLNT